MAAGTDTILVTSPVKPAPGNHKAERRPQAHELEVPHRQGQRRPKPAPRHRRLEPVGELEQNGQSSGQSNPTTPPAPTTSTPTAPTTSAPATTAPATTPPPPTPHPAPPNRTTSHKSTPTASGPLVTGRLVAESRRYRRSRARSSGDGGGRAGADRPAGHDHLAAGRDRRRTGGSRAAGPRRVVRAARPPSRTGRAHRSLRPGRGTIADVLVIFALTTHDIDEVIFHVANALRVPVLILALVALALVIFELGSFVVELRGRRRRRLRDPVERGRSGARGAPRGRPPGRSRGRQRPGSEPGDGRHAVVHRRDARGPTAATTRSTRRSPTSTSAPSGDSGVRGCSSGRARRSG